MIKNLINQLLLIGLVFSNAFAADFMDRIKRFDWNGVEVVWLEDDRFPTYNFVAYFADGALSDQNGVNGETSAMFNLLGAGTRRYTQRDISDNLEYFGVSLESNVTHEYSIFSVSGLVKDIVPTFKQVCHLFQDATFPSNELKKEKRRAIDSLKNMVTDHSSLASRAFREISLKGSPFSYPSTGKLKDIKKISQKGLKRKLHYFNDKVKKRIYISGPKKSLVIKNIIGEECGWKKIENPIVRKSEFKNMNDKTNKVYLVTVPKANQAQVRIGRILGESEIKEPELMNFMASYLGGGFTSKLMRAVRVRGGLTYSIGAYAVAQKNYGRAVISTFSRLEKVDELITTIKSSIQEVRENKFPDEELERARGYIVGSYPFGFETSSALLSQLISLDHKEKSYEEILTYPDKVSNFKREQVAKNADMVFDFNKQVIVVLGPKSLMKKLKEFGEIAVVNYKEFL